jgi:hypothetical protein
MVAVGTSLLEVVVVVSIPACNSNDLSAFGEVVAFVSTLCAGSFGEHGGWSTVVFVPATLTLFWTTLFVDDERWFVVWSVLVCGRTIVEASLFEQTSAFALFGVVDAGGLIVCVVICVVGIVVAETGVAVAA